MSARRSADTPDLFSAPQATEPKAASSVAVPADEQGSEPRHILPKDLAGALTRLNDGDIDALLSAVTTEAARRGRLPANPAGKKPITDAKSAPSQLPIEANAGRLPKGQLNAVRAAFKAGVKPSAIARQFGISQSDVRKALAKPLDRDA